MLFLVLDITLPFIETSLESTSSNGDETTSNSGSPIATGRVPSRNVTKMK
jgi:hypothetical protein